MTQGKPENKGDSIRINKYLAQKNIASRREADLLISSGKVTLNGEKAKLGDMVGPQDKVEIKGKTKDNKYFLYNKPVGIVTVGAQRNEKEISDVTKFPVKVFPIGRLDKDSSGLLIMTNDGRLTKNLLSDNWEKEYEVEVDKKLEKDFKNKMEAGVSVPKTNQGKVGFDTKPCKVKITGDYSFNIILTEGKNRQIRRMSETLGYKVTDLKRIRIGKYSIGKLKEGNLKEIKNPA